MTPHRIHRTRSTLFAQFALIGLLANFAFAPARAETCPIISQAELQAALPQYGQWKTVSAGPGGCRFEGQHHIGDSKYITLLGCTQQFFGSKAEAAETLTTLRDGFEREHPLMRLSISGAEPGGFSFRAVDPEANPGAASWWYAQANAGILSCFYNPPQEGVDDADAEAEAITQLLQTALQRTAQPTAAKKALACPYFDPGLIKKLIPGSKIKIQQFGADSCLATNERNESVLFMRMADIGENTARNVAESIDAACTTERRPDLGPLGRVNHGCTGGNPRATASYFRDGAHYQFDILPNREPDARQRADIVELARWNYTRED